LTFNSALTIAAPVAVPAEADVTNGASPAVVAGGLTTAGGLVPAAGLAPAGDLSPAGGLAPAGLDGTLGPYGGPPFPGGFPGGPGYGPPGPGFGGGYGGRKNSLQRLSAQNH
jgi:hypothetical protein